STRLPALRNLKTTLSSAPTAVRSQKCAAVTSMCTDSMSSSAKSKSSAKASDEAKNTWPATVYVRTVPSGLTELSTSSDLPTLRAKNTADRSTPVITPFARSCVATVTITVPSMTTLDTVGCVLRFRMERQLKVLSDTMIITATSAAMGILP